MGFEKMIKGKAKMEFGTGDIRMTGAECTVYVKGRKRKALW